MLVTYSSNEHTSHRHLYMVEVGNPSNTGNEDNNELLEQISEDEVTANIDNEIDTQRNTRRLKNQRHAKRRRNAAAHQRQVQRDLNAEFAATSIPRSPTLPLSNPTRVHPRTRRIKNSSTHPKGLAPA